MFGFTQFVFCKICYTQNFRGVVSMSYEKDFKDLPEGWKWVRLGEVIEEVKEKNKLNKNLPILTSSRKGIYLQDEYFNRIVASKDIFKL
jgi:hypothetical protein